MKRRNFLRQSVFGALGTALVPSTGLWAASTSTSRNSVQRGPCLVRGTSDNLTLTPADSGVLTFAADFSSRALFVGGCVAGKSARTAFRSTHLLVRISDLENFQTQMTRRGSIAGEGMVIGNSVCFNYLETTFELEALTPDVFDKRLADIQSGQRPDGTPMAYAHEALVYDPSTRALSDPFRSMSGRIGTLKRLGTPAGYEQLAEGNLDLKAYKMVGGSRDLTDLNAILNRLVTNATEARSITRALLQNLSLHSQVDSPEDVQNLCGTRAIRTATKLTLGCDSLRVAACFPSQRRRFPDVTDGSVWHALFQAAEVPVNGVRQAASLALNGRCTLKTFLTMQEFQKVNLVKTDRSFRVDA